MAGVNKVIIIGNVGGDPDTKHMPNVRRATIISLGMRLITELI